jgi:ribose/xylose/arabinose/galactoside ABC-type transport system permease subunit
VTLTADELRARRAPLADGRRRWLERLARVGMAARAVLIVLIGGLAVALALGAGGKATDSEGAMHTIAGTAWGTAVLVALAVGLVTGLFNGVMVARFRVPPFVVTLAMLTICRGLAFVITDGRSISDLPASFGLFGREVFLRVPVPVWLMLFVFAAGWFVLKRMTFGRYVYAVGGNREAAFLAGVDIKGVTLLVYVLNGLLVGLAGLVLASRLGAGVPNAGNQYELDVIAAVVVGGTSLNGGRGSVIATLWGAVFIGVLNNGLNLAGVDPYMQRIALGAVILLAVLADQLNKTRGQVIA